MLFPLYGMQFLDRQTRGNIVHSFPDQSRFPPKLTVIFLVKLMYE